MSDTARECVSGKGAKKRDKSLTQGHASFGLNAGTRKPLPSEGKRS